MLYNAWNQPQALCSEWEPHKGLARRSAQCHYLDQPTSGGTAQANAMTQVKATPIMA